MSPAAFTGTTDRFALPDAIVKVESPNFDSETGDRCQLWCVAISAKRYALYTFNAGGDSVTCKPSEHGLGPLLSPTDPDSDARDWIGAVWEGIVGEAIGRPGPSPAWLAAATGLCVRTIKAARNGHAVPHHGDRTALIRAAAEAARESLRRQGSAAPADDEAACVDDPRASAEAQRATRPCTLCGRSPSSSDPRARYCSPACRKRAARRARTPGS